MKKFKDFLKSPAAAVVLFIIAGALIIGGGIGGTRAALTVFSEQYNSRLELRDIGVSLYENDKSVGQRDYVPYSDYEWDEGGSHRLCETLTGLDGEADPTLKIGKKYKEELKVVNTGNINEYVRVIVRKYWADVDETGKVVRKRADLDPSTIDLNLIKGNGWIEAASDAKENEFSPETTVLYYTNILKPEEETSLFADTIKIKDDITAKVTETTSVDAEGYTVVTYTYEYDGRQFIIEAEVDAVQTHNAQAAILSAWGKHANFSGDVITSVD